MATHGRSGLGRWIYGSVADEIMRTSTTPVVIVPTGFTNRADTYAAGSIVVALDGSAAGEQTLTHAIALAKDLKGRLILARMVVPILVTDGGMMLEPVLVQVPDDTDAQKAEAEAYLARAADYARSHGVEVGQTQVNTGMLISGLVAREAATLLDRIATESPGRLIALTTQGHGGLGRAFLGSVATAALQHAHVPVLICRSIEDAVAVAPLGRREPGVPALGRERGVQHHDGLAAQVGVQRVAHRLGRPIPRQVHMDHLTRGVHA